MLENGRGPHQNRSELMLQVSWQSDRLSVSPFLCPIGRSFRREFMNDKLKQALAKVASRMRDSLALFSSTNRPGTSGWAGSQWGMRT